MVGHLSFSAGLVVKEREGEKKKSKFLSTIHRVLSIGIRQARTKVHCLNKGYAWVPKTRDFAKDLKEVISG